MAFSASVRKCVASETAPFVQHRKLRVTAILKLRERQMAARCLVVAAAAEIGHVAGRASRPVERRVLSVDIVLPSSGVRRGHHDLVATHALLFSHGRRLDICVTNETWRARSGSLVGVVEAETLRVGSGFHDAGMEARHGTGRHIDVANLAVRHAIVGGDALRHAVAAHAVRHLRQGQADETCAGRDLVMTSRAVKVVGVARLEMVGVRKPDLIVLSRDDKRGELTMNLCGGRIFDLFRVMTSAAIRRGRFIAE